MISIRIEYENGKEVTLYATRDDISTYLEMMRTFEHIKEVYINQKGGVTMSEKTCKGYLQIGLTACEGCSGCKERPIIELVSDNGYAYLTD